jgi:hypothetical protein
VSEAASAPKLDVFQIGIDDVTLGFDLSGTPARRRLEDAEGYATKGGGWVLGQRDSWGKWEHLLGRSYAVWYRASERLYVQAKMAPEGELVPLDLWHSGVEAIQFRMAMQGLVTHEPPWATRLDVAADARCVPAVGKSLLDAMASCRAPRGRRVEGVGSPRTTVYLKAPRSRQVYARLYCRATKLGQESFTWIRAEAQKRYEPKQLLSRDVPSVAKAIWQDRFGSLEGSVRRMPHEVLAMGLSDLVGRQEITAAQAERMLAFVTFERIGTAGQVYPLRMLSERRREARRLGFAAADTGEDGIDVDLAQMLAQLDSSPLWGEDL